MAITKAELDKYIKAYSEGNPLISDEEYDILMEEYVKENGEESRPFYRQKQSDSINTLVGTLPKLYGVTKPMRQGQKTYREHFYDKYELYGFNIAIQYKFDGCSVGFDFETEKFNTRGDYDNGESVDVTELFKSKIPQMYRLNKKYNNKLKSAKFEYIMPVGMFEQFYSDKYKRPRDVVSASITKRDDSIVKNASLIPLRMYDEDNNVYINPDISTKWCADDEEYIQYFIDEISNNNFKVLIEFDFNNSKEEYECDGVVISVIDDDHKELTVYKDLEAAIKIINVVKQTKLIDIHYEFGNTGRITPVAILEPVLFDKIKVDHVSLSNIYRVKKEKLKHNDTVDIMYNIVPYLIRSHNDGDSEFRIPTNCPICNKPLEVLNEGKTVTCTNENCNGRRIGTITYYCKNIGAIGINESTVSKLIEFNIISNIPDLYNMNLKDISTIPGLGDKSAFYLSRTIYNASTNIQLPRFLGSFPIQNVGAKTWDAILSELQIDEKRFNNMTFDQFKEILLNNKIQGVGRIMRTLIIKGLETYWDQIQECMTYVTFEHYNLSKKECKGVITLTGTRDKELTKMLIEAGYDVREWSKNTTIVIAKNVDEDSRTIRLAIQNGIPLYSIENAKKALLGMNI